MNSGIPGRACSEIDPASIFALVRLSDVIDAQRCWLRRCPEEGPIVEVLLVLPMRRFLRVLAAQIITETNVCTLHFSASLTGARVSHKRDFANWTNKRVYVSRVENTKAT